MNTNYKLETKILTCLRANTSQKIEGEKLITKQFKYFFLRYKEGVRLLISKHMF